MPPFAGIPRGGLLVPILFNVYLYRRLQNMERGQPVPHFEGLTAILGRILKKFTEWPEGGEQVGKFRVGPTHRE
jgi:hypothetical protein